MYDSIICFIKFLSDLTWKVRDLLPSLKIHEADRAVFDVLQFIYMTRLAYPCLHWLELPSPLSSQIGNHRSWGSIPSYKPAMGHSAIAAEEARHTTQ